MKMYAVVAVAVLLLATPLCAQESVEVTPPVPPPQSSTVPGAAPSRPAASSPSAPVPVTNDGRQSQTTIPIALRDLSAWSMFLSADPLVKAVIVSLLLASLVTWTIFLAKAAKLGLARRQLEKSLVQVSGAKTLAEA